MSQPYDQEVRWTRLRCRNYAENEAEQRLWTSLDYLRTGANHHAGRRRPSHGTIFAITNRVTGPAGEESAVFL